MTVNPNHPDGPGPAQIGIVIPDDGVSVLDPSSGADWRDLLHKLALVLVPLFIAKGYMTNDQVSMYLPLIFTVIDPLFSWSNAQDKVRKYIYGIGGVVATVLVAVGGWSEEFTVSIIGMAVSIVVSFIAARNTVTSNLKAV